jgi:di/tricarboxylate transporter
MVIGGLFLQSTHCIEENAFWHAMSLGPLLACCAIPAVAQGITNTNMMKKILKCFLPMESCTLWSRFLLFLMTGCLSTIVDNFAVIGMLKHTYLYYASETKCNIRTIMMPLSFISQIGGTCTLIASGTMLVIDAFFAEEEPKYELGFFQMGTAAFPCVVVCSILLAVLSPMILAPAEEDDKVRSSDIDLNEKGHKFLMKTYVEDSFVAKKFEGPESIQIHFRTRSHNIIPIGRELDEFASPTSSDVNLRKVGMSVSQGNVRYCESRWENVDWMEDNGIALCEFKEEFLPIEQDENTVFAEGVVHPDSEFVGKRAFEINDPVWKIVGIHAIDLLHDGDDKNNLEVFNRPIHGGDLLLLKGTKKDLRKYNRNFVSIAAVLHEHGSMHMYAIHTWISFLCLISIIILCASKKLTLLNCVVLSLTIMQVTGALNMEEMLHKFKWTTLLFIAGAYGLKNAIDDTGLCRIMSGYIVKCIPDTYYVDIFTYCLIYFIALIIGFILPPKAEIGILYPICKCVLETLKDDKQRVKHNGMDDVVLILVAAQGTAIQLLTPNNPENTLVQNRLTNYKRSEYLKLGLPLAILSGVIYISIIVNFPVSGLGKTKE